MSYFDQRDSYRQYGGSDYPSDPRRNSDSFSEDRTRAKRKRWSGGRGGKRGGKGSGNRNPNSNASLNDSPVFKEPISPGPRRSPPPKMMDQRKRGRNNSFRSSYVEPNHYFEMRDMPDFVEPQHLGSTFHWDGYTQRCRAWQDKHKLAYYRSRCTALEFENQMLMEQIRKLIDENCVFAVERGRTPTMQVPDIPDRHIWQLDEHHTSSNPNSKSPVKEKREKGGDTNEATKSGKENEGPIGYTAQKRKEELALLYGENSTVIQELETSLQLNFHRNCEDFKPEIFPSIPLNPETLVA